MVVVGRGSGGKAKKPSSASSAVNTKGKVTEKTKQKSTSNVNSTKSIKSTQQKLPTFTSKQENPSSKLKSAKDKLIKKVGKKTTPIVNPSPTQNQINKTLKLNETMVTSTNGPRIHAQRKFAQAGNIYSGTLQINSINTPSESTPIKRSHESTSTASTSKKQIKKPPFSPPPNKRPRTDDFLTFLCFRGTPSLPPELDFFNYPQINDFDEKRAQPKKKILPQSVSQISSVVDSFSKDGTNATNSTSAQITSSKLIESNSKTNGKNKEKEESSIPVSKSTTKGTAKQTDKSKKKDDSSSKKSFADSNSNVGTSSKADNPTKGIRATASSVILSKIKKSSTPALKASENSNKNQTSPPALSPAKSRLNENDARFAMTALKLKYQRMATTKPNRSLLLTKKVKEKSIILTRSKARSVVSAAKSLPISKLPTKKGKLGSRTGKVAVISPSRNAPSPDIIFGVISGTPNSKRKSSMDKKQVSESESKDESSDSEESKSSDSESSGEEDEKKQTKTKQQLVRSLRSGKEIIRSKSPTVEKKRRTTAVTKKSKSLDFNRRVGTRSAQRITKSPLRELPMYTDKKPNTKLKKKKLVKSKNKPKSDSKSSKEEEKNEKSSTNKKSLKELPPGVRPSRKTKETAAFYMGLLTKGFSTDEEDSDDGGKVEDGGEDSELGSSSSSETKFLEKHYNASLKRVQLKKEKPSSSNKSKSKTDIRTKSNKKEDVKSKSKKSEESSDKNQTKKSQDSKSSKSTTKEESRKLRSQRAKTIQDLDEVVAKRRNLKSPAEGRRLNRDTPNLGENKKMAGAARKSASVVSRRRSRYSSSSGEEEENQSSSSPSSEESSTSDNELPQEEDEMEMSEEENEEADDEESEKIDTTNSKKEAKKSVDSKSKAKTISKTAENTNKSTDKITNKKSPSKNYVREESKTIASEMRRLVEQKRARSSSLSSTKSSVKSRNLNREDSVETEQCKASLNGSRSRSPSVSVHSIASSSSSSSSASENDSSSSSESSDDEEQEDAPIKVDMATQVDMDLEDGIIPISIPEQERIEQQKLQQQQQQQQQAQQQSTESSDDEVQEIGQVFASSSSSTSTTHQFTSHHHHHHHHHVEENHHSISRDSTGTIGYSYHQEHLQQQQQQHLGSIYNPFTPRTSITEQFYTPLQLTPSPLVHSSIQLIGGNSFPVSNPLNTLSIPVSVPHLSSLSSQFLSHAPIGFTTGSTFHSATTLQTHIRSVATNLDIPLVRPVVGSDPSMNFMTSSARGPSIGLSINNSLTRPPNPMGMWTHPPHHHTQSHQQSHHQTQHQMDPNRNHYSAFKSPHPPIPPQQVIHHQSTTVLGMNSNTGLPVSIVHPQPNSHHSSMQGATTSSNVPQPTYSHYQQKVTPTPVTSASSSSSSSKNHNTPPGYNIIKNLPNVSIVPKFDRNSKPATHLPSQEPAFSKNKHGSSSSKGVKTHQGDSSSKSDEPKKVGRKKKQNAILPQPSSPLTVRKDSNPATYVGISAKKYQKKDGTTKETSQAETQAQPHQNKKSEHKQEQGDKFLKLLKMKKNGKEEKCKSESPGPSCSSSKIDKKVDSSAKTTMDNSSNSKSGSSKSSSSVIHISPVVEKLKSNEKAAEVLNGIREAPTFRPTDQEFEDPLKYIQKIQLVAEKFGMARIVPPRSFRPECNVEDDMRFTAYNHYIHKMYQRWGPNVLESQMIKENLKNSQVDVSEVSMIGGMEINLSTLYQTVKSFGGLKEVIEKERWTKVADTMHVPKAAHDRATKLDLIYVKYVLPYEILSDGEREKLKKKVEKRWNKRKEKILKAAENSEDENSDEDSMDELDECIVKGKTTPLSTYYRVARNTNNIFFPTEKVHSTEEIEEEYWNIVRERNRHVCVYSGSIDCAGVGWGFPIPKASNKHPWNLKVLANNQGSVLRSMGPVMGATVPTLHVSMLFATYCWYRDPHSLPWLEYLHSGANKVWYSVAVAHEEILRKALTELMPMQCKKKRIWLASDSAMVPPDVLVAKGVPLVRAVQNPGEFLVVFPKAYTSAICTGYLISESVCFAYPSWLQSCLQTFKDIRNSKEPPVFPLEQLLLSILQDARASLDVVRMALSPTKEVIKEEISLRKKVTSLGVKYGGKISNDTDSSSGTKSSSKKKGAREEEIEQCYYCNYSLFLSMVRNKKTDSTMCLQHALEHFSRHKADIKKSTILYDMDEEQFQDIVDNASRRCGNRKSSD